MLLRGVSRLCAVQYSTRSICTSRCASGGVDDNSSTGVVGKVSKSVKQALDKASQAASDALGKASETVDSGTGQAKDAYNTVKDKVGEAYDSTTNKASNLYEDVKQEAGDMAGGAAVPDGGMYKSSKDAVESIVEGASSAADQGVSHGMHMDAGDSSATRDQEVGTGVAPGVNPITGRIGDKTEDIGKTLSEPESGTSKRVKPGDFERN